MGFTPRVSLSSGQTSTSSSSSSSSSLSSSSSWGVFSVPRAKKQILEMEMEEPISPKVTCIGQVRNTQKKKNNSSSSSNNNNKMKKKGRIWFRRTSNLGRDGRSSACSDFAKDISCFLCNPPTKLPTYRQGKSCGAVFAKSLLLVQESEDGKQAIAIAINQEETPTSSQLLKIATDINGEDSRKEREDDDEEEEDGKVERKLKLEARSRMSTMASLRRKKKLLSSLPLKRSISFSSSNRLSSTEMASRPRLQKEKGEDGSFLLQPFPASPTAILLRKCRSDASKVSLDMVPETWLRPESFHPALRRKQGRIIEEMDITPLEMATRNNNNNNNENKPINSELESCLRRSFSARLCPPPGGESENSYLMKELEEWNGSRDISDVKEEAEDAIASFAEEEELESEETLISETPSRISHDALLILECHMEGLQVSVINTAEAYILKEGVVVGRKDTTLAKEDGEDGYRKDRDNGNDDNDHLQSTYVRWKVSKSVEWPLPTTVVLPRCKSEPVRLASSFQKAC